MLVTGVDLIEIERIHHAIERYGDHFLARVYTAAELQVCKGKVESLTARFAAKEAVGKALGTGIWREGVAWTDIEIVKNARGAPVLRLYDGAALRAHEIGIREWSISLSHDRGRAVAFVVGQ